MAVPQNKDELLQAIERNFTALLKTLSQVPAERFFTPELPGQAKNTQMSVANLCAYLIGWNRLVLKWHARDQQGLNIDFPETGFKWNQLGLLAQKFYQDYAQLDSADEVIAQLKQAKQDIVQLVSSYSNETLYGGTWYDKWTMGRMIQFNTASPYKNAQTRLRTYLKQQV